MKKSCSEKEVHPPAESTEKIVDPFARVNRARTYFDCLVLTKCPAGRAKVFVWRNVASARMVNLPPQKGEPAAMRVTLLAKPTSFFTFTRFATFF